MSVIQRCSKCVEPAEFGYKIKGEMQWFCDKHRLSQNYADARLSAKSNSQPSAEKPTGWRGVLPIHPAAELFPLMTQEELRELADDIKKHGLTEPPSLYQDPKLGLCVLDGRNRLDALELLGRSTADAGRTVEPTDPFAFVTSKNIHRRHLNTEQRQDLLIKLIARQPERSDRQIAKTAGADHKTISAARAKGEDVGRIPHVETRTDTKGRQQPAKKSKPDPAPPAGAMLEPIQYGLLDRVKPTIMQMNQATKKALARWFREICQSEIGVRPTSARGPSAAVARVGRS